MLEKIVQWSLKNWLAIPFFAIAVAAWGVWSFSNLTIEAFPDPTDPQVEIVTQFAGQSTEEVERQIGLPLERALNGTPGLLRMRNMSLFGLSDIVLTFEDRTDLLQAREQVLQRLRGAELPEGVVPELAPLATPIGEIYRYVVDGAQGDIMKLRQVQDWIIRPQLLRVQGVADAVTFGGLDRQIHVTPSPARLAAYGVTLGELEDALEKASHNTSGGMLERGGEGLVVTSHGLFGSLKDIGDVGVVERDGAPVLVRDVADVAPGWAPRQGVASHGRDWDVVQAKVLMRRGENPSVVLRRVREKIAEINAGLPDGVRIVPFYDRTVLVDKTLHTVSRNLLEGAVLVVLVLWTMLMSLRAALIVGSLIPLSLLVSFIYLSTRGMSANLLSMGAVDFGIIVDGAVVIVEAVLLNFQRQAHSPAPANPMEAVRLGVASVLRPTVFSLAIIIAAYIPMFMLERVEGRIFAPMAHTVVSALTGALLLSVTLVPVLAWLFYHRRAPRHRESPVLKAAARAYAPALRWALRRPKRILGAALAMVAVSGLLVPRLGSEFLPAMNEGSLYLTFSLPQNISLTEARRWMPRIYQTFSRYPAVEDVLMLLGRPEDGTDPNLPNNLEALIKLKPPEEWPAGIRNVDELVTAMTPLVAQIPGASVTFSQPIADSVNDSLSGQPGDIACKLYGNDLKQLQDVAERWKAVLADVEGVADLGIVKSGMQPQISVTPDRTALARFGLDMESFQHVVGSALGGTEVGTLWEGEIPVPITLRYPLGARADAEKIKLLQVPVGGGHAVPLKLLAKVESDFGRASILRENGKRYIGLRMNVRGRDLGSFMQDAMGRTLAKAPLPAGVSVEWGGAYESKERAMKRLGAVMPVTLVLTFVLLFASFGDVALALMVLLTIPLALVGGVFGLFAMSLPVSVAAAVGFIALIGQAALNGVLILSAIQERVKRGMAHEQAILEGCLERLRPVLMTGSLAAIGLVPAALSRDMGAETQQPIAVVIVCGTLSAMALTLFVLPVLYAAIAKATERFVKREEGFPLAP